MSVAIANEVGRERRDRVSLALSLVFHFFALLLIASMLARPLPQAAEPVVRVVTITQRPLTIEHRTKRPHSAPAVSHAAAAASRPAAQVHVPEMPFHIALPVPHVLEPPVLPRTPHAVAFVPHRTTVPIPTKGQRAGAFSDARIAQIDRDLGAAIAGDRAASRDVLAGTTSQPDYDKHYAPDVSSLTTGGLGSRGLCDPIKSWESDGYNYYFVSCNVRFSDGTYEREPVPWPIRYKPNHDPFDGTASNEELPLPLPGWSLPSGETVAKGVRGYAAAHGFQFPE